MNNPCSDVLNFKPVEEADVIKIIDNLSSKNSCGIDKINTKLLKTITPYITKSIAFITNQSLASGVFPDELKIAKIVPIFKKNDPTLLDNYRPISLLPVFSKIFERVIFDQLHNHFNLHNLYFTSQYGFRKKHSTESAVLELVDKTIKHMDSGDVPISIFLDLSKAFDTLDHDILLDKLSYYGVKETALSLFKSYLSNRKQYVEYLNTTSNFTDIKTGVPQSSILGPLLFIIYINYFPSASTIFSLIMYADDTTLCSTLNAFKSKSQNETLNGNINKELCKIDKWLKLNKLSLNTTKSKFVIFHMPQKRVEIPIININNVNIECVANFDFLGVTIDKKLSWNGHTDKISLKLSRCVGIPNKLKRFLP